MIDNTDNDEFSLDIENLEEHGYPIQPDSKSENEERNFVIGKVDEAIWTTLTFRKKTSRTLQRNIVIHLPGA